MIRSGHKVVIDFIDATIERIEADYFEINFCAPFFVKENVFFFFLSEFGKREREVFFRICINDNNLRRFQHDFDVVVAVVGFAKVLDASSMHFKNRNSSFVRRPSIKVTIVELYSTKKKHRLRQTLAGRIFR